MKIGDRAPDFSLPATGERTVTRADARLIYVFPAAFTPAAALDLSTLERRARDRSPIGVSVDSVWACQIFSASLGGLSFPLASDLKREWLGACGLVNDDGTARRAWIELKDDGTVSAFRTLGPDEPLPL